MAHITVAYTGSRDPLSWLARAVTGNAKWSHCGIVVGIYDVGIYVLEARLYYGVVGTPIDEWQKRCPHHEFLTIECPDPQAGEDFAWAQIGKPYDYLGALSVPFRSHWQDLTRWFCSELVEAAVLAAKRVRFRDDKQSISPQESRDVV